MKRVLIITYYWPPSGGSGVQRWMYFAIFLKKFGLDITVLTVDPEKASYKFLDTSFKERVKDIKTVFSSSFEPYRLYAKLINKSRNDAIPLGFVGEDKPTLIKKLSRFIRGNFFLPDARMGWIKSASQKAIDILQKEKFDCLVTTGPPHSAHVVGLNVKKVIDIKWIADFRDPWTELYYNKQLYRTFIAKRIDKGMEAKVIETADLVLTMGPSMKKLLQSKTSRPERVHFILNGYDADAFIGIKRTRDDDDFVICHLGILGENQPVTGFVRALKLFFESDKLALAKTILKFVGAVSQSILNEIKEEIPGLKIIEVAYLPQKDSLVHIKNADLLFGSLAATEGGQYLISGKLMEYIATGNPILCLGEANGDAAKLLEEFENAKVFDRTDINGMIVFLNKIYQSHKNYESLPANKDIQKYSRENTSLQLKTLIESLIVN